MANVGKTARRRAKLVDNALAQWISQNAAPLFVEASESVAMQGRALARIIREERDYVSAARLRRLANFEALLLAAGAEPYAALREIERRIQTDINVFAELGQETAAELIRQIRDDEEPEVGGGLVLDFELDDYVDRMNLLADSIQEVLEDYLLEHLPYSTSPESVIEDAVADAFGTGLVWLTGLIDIVMMRGYRAGERFIFTRHEPELIGWMWYATLDHRTCPSCVALHGQIFPLSEVLVDHPRGRCEPIPVFSDYAGLEGIEPGISWLSRQSEETQRTILGPARYNAWKAGAVDLSEYSVIDPHPVYGPIRRAASLKEVLGDDAVQFYKNQ